MILINRVYIITMLLLIFSITVCDANFSTNSKIFIMLNVDNTIIDRIDPDNNKLINKLSENGFTVKKLEFDATKLSSPKFIKMYQKLANNEKLSDESEYMSQIKVEKINQERVHVTEYIAIKPNLNLLLEKLHNLGMPIVILITSRNDDERTKNLINHFPIKIMGHKFKDMVTFIPRDWFRVKIKTNTGEEISVKSAVELRKKYSKISKKDYIVLLDHLETSRFIKSNINKDLNIEVAKFIATKYDDYKDTVEIDHIIKLIKDFVRI